MMLRTRESSTKALTGLTACLVALSICATLGLFLSGARQSRASEADRVHLLMREVAGKSWDEAVQASMARMDPALLDLAMRFTANDAEISGRGALIQLDRENQPLGNALSGMTPEQALLFNAAMPFSTDPNPAARPFYLKTSALDESRAVECLTKAIYYEAGFESLEGREAVAQVVLNRLRHPAFPKTVCGVVFQGAEMSTGCQFSFTCDGSLNRAPAAWAWREAEQVAARALNGFVMRDVGNATHYHTQWVVPYWASRLVKVRQIGAHIFYRWTGGWGLPDAFRLQYAGGEVAPGTQAQPVVSEASFTVASLTPTEVEAATASPLQTVAAIDPPAPAPAASNMPEPEPVAVQLEPVAAAPVPPEPKRPARAPRLAVPNGW